MSAEPARRIEATDEEVTKWVQHKRETFADAEEVFTVENLHDYQLDEDETWELITLGRGCSLTWVAEDGSPGGTFAKQAVFDHTAYLLLLDGDDAIPALRHDPRAAVVFDGGDGVGAVTARGTMEFVDDLPTLVRVVLAVARRDGLSEPQVAQRVRAAQRGREHVVRLNPERFVTFTHKKIFRTEAEAAAAAATNESMVTGDDHLVSAEEVGRLVAEKQAEQTTSSAPAMRVSADLEDAWAVIRDRHEINHAYGGAVSWPTKDGSVASAYVGFGVLDGEVWTTTTKGRGKTYAMLRDPRSVFIMVSADRKRSTTIYGRVELSNGEEDVTRFAIGFGRYRGGAEEIGPGISSFDSPGRYAVRFVIERAVTRTEA